MRKAGAKRREYSEEKSRRDELRERQAKAQARHWAGDLLRAGAENPEASDGAALSNVADGGEAVVEDLLHVLSRDTNSIRRWRWLGSDGGGRTLHQGR